MFEIPDDDESFWNDVPLDNNIPSKTDVITGKENRPQLRVPDTVCTGNPAKRLCTDFNRDGTLPVQAEKSFPQLRSINKSDRTEPRENSRIYPESPFHIPFPTTTSPSSETVTNLNSECSSSKPVLVAGTGKNHPKPIEENTDTFSKHSGVAVSSVNSSDSGRIDYSNHGNRILSVASNTMESDKDPNLSVEKRYVCQTSKNTACLNTASTGYHTDTGITENRTTGKGQSERTDIQVKRNDTLLNDSDSSKVMAGQNNMRDSSGVNEDVNRSRSTGFSVGDHVTPKRKRKFPGPAGILPKLGPGRGLDVMSPAALNTVPPVANKSPQDDSVMLCSQSTDDIFSDSAWQALLRDMGDDGQKLLKKFSISSTLLKAGKRQLFQGKAALIFGVIDTIESHGSEASVTIRDKSGRMQGTVHRDLFKEHETDLQIGTVLVLKQVSIISLSNRNHYLNITPNNVVVLYCGGQSALRTLKFHGSEDSLQSVLSALERKAAAHRNSLNNSGTMTPSSLTGSSRQPLTNSGTGTPQLFGPSPGTPVMNQHLFSPRTPVTSHPAGVRTPVTSHPAGLRTPVPATVRDVSIVGRNGVPAYQRFGNSTPDANLRQNTFGNSTPVANFRNSTFSNSTPNANLRPGFNTAVNGSVSSQITTDATILSTPNTNFKVIPVQNNTNFSRLNSPMNRPLINSSPSTCTGSSVLSNSNVNNVSVKTAVQQHSYQKQAVTTVQQQSDQCKPVVNTPDVSGKSKWKFKSPPGRSGSLPSSPDLRGFAGNSNNTKVGHKSGVSFSTAYVNSSDGRNVNGNGGVQTAKGGVVESKSSGMNNRSCQLNNQNFTQQAESRNGTNRSMNSGTTTAWSFKPSTKNNTVDGMAKQTESSSKSDKQLPEDCLWEDDLSDDLLSQLSEDLT